MRRAGHVAHVEVLRTECTIVVGNYERKEPLERPRGKWEDTVLN
jgi:hypothetical protein